MKKIVEILLWSSVAVAVSANSALAACNIVNGTAYGDCSGVTLNSGASPFRTVSGAESISGIAEGAHVLSGGVLHVSGIAERVIVDAGGEATVGGIVRYLEVSGTVAIAGQVDSLRLVQGGRADVKGVIFDVSGAGTLHLSEGAVVGGVPTVAPRVVMLGQ